MVRALIRNGSDLGCSGPSADQPVRISLIWEGELVQKELTHAG